MVLRQTKGGKARVAGAERKQFLVHIDPDLIRRVKILAIHRQVSASSLVQEAIIELLARSDAAARAQE